MNKNFMRFVRSGSWVLVLLSVFQSAAFADAIEGRVAQASSRALDVTVYDAQGRPYPNTLHLKVDGATRVSGVRSVSELQPNDPIGAQVRQEETGVWRADSVQLFQQMNAKPATAKPSNALKDMLGNPVARGALLGAATGAIAASASHGKAGKGALVGAGVGAAAGLLESWFNKPADTSQDSGN